LAAADIQQCWIGAAMGANGSMDFALCSTTTAGGIGAPEYGSLNAAERKRMYEMPQEGEFNMHIPACGCSDAEVLAWKREHELRLRPMQVAPKDDIVNDRINPWTRDLQTTGDASCSANMVNLASCGTMPPSKTKAPKDYMADMPDDGAIVLNSRGQCVLKMGESRQKGEQRDYRAGGSSYDPHRDLAGEARQIQELEDSLDSQIGNDLVFPNEPNAVTASRIQPIAPQRYDRV
jgi:hypothetical protein